MEDIIRIGTRGSALALWQAYHISDLLASGGLSTEIVKIETQGDKILDRSLSKIGSKGVFTAELEDALYTNRIDIAVHSAKDLPSELPDGLEIIAFTERERVNDVLVSFNKEISLTDGKPWIIGTSSTRRVAMLQHYYPYLKTTDMRGNLQTRMRKLQEGQCDALVLAFAGVHRMEYDEHIVAYLPTDTFTPAVGQGSVAVEASVKLEPSKRQRIRTLVNHPTTEIALRTERAYLKRLQGGCSIPSFGLANFDSQEDTVTLQAGIISLDGTRLVAKSLQQSSANAELMGYQMADEILNSGGAEILRKIREQQMLNK
ncbi:hydroxymethylbilane synthase [Cytophagaceae bacterium DM2B3-1]|uniref:Porphobilinogen deaminase n=1 Tax=Xanthocytophaga flava TaxID=3048013 RepID=A0ABT7CRN2_9BACT|nr:hydroxymethylbilane synthase [Xanthocytophaga flavus]MDJ1468597.1 hydroxymethylbilane synthase [Xanthocytophaga flavus]MDJ1496377.1 hydroxymethylbilane synthase [Xanthocytophaga flavus]